jgi:hypothetical protein
MHGSRQRSVALILSHLLRGAAVLLPAAGVMLVAADASAQGSGVIQGRVRDAASKAPIGDAVVTITSPQMQGEQTIVTDSSGSYRMPALPPGVYQINIDKEGFKPSGRGGITLRVDATIQVNLELLPEGLKAEEVVVVGRAPVVDVGSSSTGVNVNSDFVNRVPLNPPGGRGSATRSFEDLAIAAPGAHSDEYGVSISGTTSPENAYLVDGLNVGDPAYGLLASPLSVEFIDQVNVITGGYLPEFGKATGGVIDAVTKTGSNEFHGSAFFTISPGGMEGPQTLVQSNGSTVTYQQHLSSLRDFGATVGGPIIKDKLWFFVGVDFAFTRYNIPRSLSAFTLDKKGNEIVCQADAKGNLPSGCTENSGFALTTAIPNSTTNYYATAENIQVFTKLTYNINQDNHLSLSFSALPNHSGGNGNFGIENQLQVPQTPGVAGNITSLTNDFIDESYDTVLKYTASWDNKRWLLDATVGWHHQHDERAPDDGSAPGSNNASNLSGVPQVVYDKAGPEHSLTDFEHVPAGFCKFVNGNPTCPVDNYYAGGPGFVNDALLDRYSGKVLITHLIQGLGHHVIKAGGDVEYLHYDQKTAYTGNVLYEESSGGDYFSDYRSYGNVTGPNQFGLADYYESNSRSISAGGFIQDSWSVFDRVTINGGFRYDAQFVSGDGGAAGINLPSQWSPRIGFVWDPTREGKAKIFGNFARFYEGVPLDIADRSFPGQSGIASYHNSGTQTYYGNQTSCSPVTQGSGTGSCSSNANRNNFFSGPSSKGINTSADPEPIDPDLHAQSNDEWVVGGEYEIFEDATLGLSYTHRYQNYIIEDMSKDEGNTYFIGNPGYGIAKDFPAAERNYDAVTVYFTKAFSHTWLAQASYTVSALRGNWAGLFRADTTQLDPNINSDFDLRSLLPNRTGPLNGDRTHQLKIFTAKDFKLPANWVIQVGGTFTGHSGEPTNYLGANLLYGSGEAYVLPRGSGPRLPWVFDFDGHIGGGYQINKDTNILIGMDVFNIFDFQQVTSIDENFTFQPVTPLSGGKPSDVAACQGVTAQGKCPLIDPTTGKAFPKANYNLNFQKPTSYQAPREFRFTMKVTF